MNPSERVRLRKEMRQVPDVDPALKWEGTSNWLKQFEDSDRWALVMLDGDRYPCVPIGFILECVWRSHWVASEEVDGGQRLVTGFGGMPETLPKAGSAQNYSRGAWVFEAQLRVQRHKPLAEQRPRVLRRFSPDSTPSRLDLSTPVGQCNPQQIMEALIVGQGRWNCFDPEPILNDLYSNTHLWIHFMMMPLIAEYEGSNYLYSNLGLTLRDLSDRWHADTLYIWTRDDDCVYPLVDFGKAWSADDVQVMDRDRASAFIGYGGCEDPPPVVVYWWD